MLVEANREPPDIVIYMNGSVTRNRSGWGFLAKQGRRTVHVSMRYLPNLQPRETRHKVEQVKVYLSAMQRPKNSLRPNPPWWCQRRKGVKTGKRHAMGGPSRLVNPACVQFYTAQVGTWQKRTVGVQVLLRDSAARQPRHSLCE